MPTQDDMAQGHEFTVAVSIQGVSQVVGDPRYTQDNWIGEPFTTKVRAWNLPDALRAAADVPLAEWDLPE